METLKAHDWKHTLITASVTALVTLVPILWAVEQWRVALQTKVEQQQIDIGAIKDYDKGIEEKWKPLVNMNTSVIVRHYPDEVKEYRMAQGWK